LCGVSKGSTLTLCLLMLVLLLAVNLKEALADTIRSPYLVRQMEAFSARVPSAFLLIYLSMFVFAVLSHPT
jgi:hypothetical protein